MSAKPILLPASISSGLLLSSPSLLSLHSLVLHFLTPPQAVSSLIPQNSAPTQATICPQFVPLQPQISWCPATFALMPPLSSYMSFSGCARLSFPLPSSPHHHSLSSLISLHPHSPAFFALLFADSVAQSIFPDSPVWGGCLVPLNAAWET